MVTKSKKSLKSKVITKSKSRSTKKKMPQTLGKKFLSIAVGLTAIYGAYSLYRKYVNAKSSDGNSQPNVTVDVQMDPIPGAYAQKTPKQNLT